MLANSSGGLPGHWLILVNLLLIVCGALVAYLDLGLPFIAAVCIAAVIAQYALWRTSSTPTVAPLDPRIAGRAERFRRTDEERRAAIRDEATQLYHRWYIEQRLEQEAARCTRYGLSMAVLVLKVGKVGLDAFSADSWRDQALQTARSTAAVVRNVDLAAALSPIEYAICLVHCDRVGAERVRERLVNKLPDYDCLAGIAVFPDDGYPASALIELARARLKAADPAA